MIRVLAAVGAAVSVLGAAGPPASTGRPVAPASTEVVVYSAPVPEPLRVVRGFDPPSTQYGPGHRGVDLAATSGQIVRSAGAGVVGFAGLVAGRGVIVVLHADGVRTEYEPVHPLVSAGAVVSGGEPVGRLAGVHPGCGTPRCLHWGARCANAYIDPLALLHSLGPVRLLPWDR